MDAARSQPAASLQPPIHVAIIMDGNGRWAKARGLPRVAGHRRGVEAVRTAVNSAVDLGIRYMTLYGFSSENWKRPRFEVSELMTLLRRYLRSEIAELNAKGVRIRFIGERGRLGADIVDMIEQAERQTAGNTKLDLIIALSYGGRGEIARAAREIAQGIADGALAPDDITEESFGRYLFTTEIPDPDLVIRTSGEQRLSNFLLWQTAYSELIFTDTLWPDFSRADFESVVREFHRRERRYGAAGG